MAARMFVIAAVALALRGGLALGGVSAVPTLVVATPMAPPNRALLERAVLKASSEACEPGCGARVDFKMSRYRNPPTLAHPWDRGWYGKP